MTLKRLAYMDKQWGWIHECRTATVWKIRQIKRMTATVNECQKKVVNWMVYSQWMNGCANEWPSETKKTDRQFVIEWEAHALYASVCVSVLCTVHPTTAAAITTTITREWNTDESIGDEWLNGMTVVDTVSVSVLITHSTMSWVMRSSYWDVQN